MSAGHTEGRIEAAGSLVKAPGGSALSMMTLAQVFTVPEDARRLAACWNALQAFSTEEIERGIDLVELVRERDAAIARTGWLARMHTLHRAVEMLYVVDGYLVTVTWDDEPISPGYKGATLVQAIDKAMAEFDANAKPKWVDRKCAPVSYRERYDDARALLTEINRDTMSVLAFGMHARIDAFLAGGGA